MLRKPISLIFSLRRGVRYARKSQIYHETNGATDLQQDHEIRDGGERTSSNEEDQGYFKRLRLEHQHRLQKQSHIDALQRAQRATLNADTAPDNHEPLSSQMLDTDEAQAITDFVNSSQSDQFMKEDSEMSPVSSQSGGADRNAMAQPDSQWDAFTSNTDNERERSGGSEYPQQWFADFFNRTQAGEASALKKDDNQDAYSATKSVDGYDESSRQRSIYKPERYLKTYTFATLVNDSPTLQHLVDIGVDFSKIERKGGRAVNIFTKLNFDKDVKPLLQFLVKHGVPLHEGRLGKFLTKNPWILSENLIDLEARVNYLESKKFSKEAIGQILTKDPMWLNFPTVSIDRRLGWLQREFRLSGDEVRAVVTRSPKLATFGIGYMQLLQFAFHEEMGFTVEDMRKLLIAFPPLWLQRREGIVKTFDYCHNQIGFSHERLLTYPKILKCSWRHVKQRHEFLKLHDRAQYDSEKPNYVSLQMLSQGTDVEFCKLVAKVPIAVYNEFLKTM